MADQTGLVRIAVATLHCVACLDCDSISDIEHSASWARDRSAALVVRSLALAVVTDVLQLVAAAVVVVLVPGSS